MTPRKAAALVLLAATVSSTVASKCRSAPLCRCVREGFLPRGGTIAVRWMDLEAAKEACDLNCDCVGFTYDTKVSAKGGEQHDLYEIFFKDKTVGPLASSNTWKTYGECSPSMCPSDAMSAPLSTPLASPGQGAEGALGVSAATGPLSAKKGKKDEQSVCTTFGLRKDFPDSVSYLLADLSLAAEKEKRDKKKAEAVCAVATEASHAETIQCIGVEAVEAQASLCKRRDEDCQHAVAVTVAQLVDVCERLDQAGCVPAQCTAAAVQLHAMVQADASSASAATEFDQGAVSLDVDDGVALGASEFSSPGLQSVQAKKNNDDESDPCFVFGAEGQEFAKQVRFLAADLAMAAQNEKRAKKIPQAVCDKAHESPHHHMLQCLNVPAAKGLLSTCKKRDEECNLDAQATVAQMVRICQVLYDADCAPPSCYSAGSQLETMAGSAAVAAASALVSEDGGAVGDTLSASLAVESLGAAKDDPEFSDPEDKICYDYGLEPDFSTRVKLLYSQMASVVNAASNERKAYKAACETANDALYAQTLACVGVVALDGQASTCKKRDEQCQMEVVRTAARMIQVCELLIKADCPPESCVACSEKVQAMLQSRGMNVESALKLVAEEPPRTAPGPTAAQPCLDKQHVNKQRVNKQHAEEEEGATDGAEEEEVVPDADIDAAVAHSSRHARHAKASRHGSARDDAEAAVEEVESEEEEQSSAAAATAGAHKAHLASNRRKSSREAAGEAPVDFDDTVAEALSAEGHRHGHAKKSARESAEAVADEVAAAEPLARPPGAAYLVGCYSLDAGRKDKYLEPLQRYVAVFTGREREDLSAEECAVQCKRAGAFVLNDNSCICAHNKMTVSEEDLKDLKTSPKKCGCNSKTEPGSLVDVDCLGADGYSAMYSHFDGEVVEMADNIREDDVVREGRNPDGHLVAAAAVLAAFAAVAGAARRYRGAMASLLGHRKPVAPRGGAVELL